MKKNIDIANLDLSLDVQTNSQTARTYSFVVVVISSRNFLITFRASQVYWNDNSLSEGSSLLLSILPRHLSYVLLSAKELITKVVGDSFERQHESQRYQASGFLEDIHIFLVLERKLSLGTVISLRRNQLLSKYLQYYF